MGIGDLIEKFRGVALDRIERMNLIMVALEREPDDGSSSEELLREIHTLKGEAKMMGFADINLVAHQTESLLIAASERKFDVAPGFVDCIFEGFDVLRLLLTKRAGAADEPIDMTGFNERASRIIHDLEDAAGGGDADPPTVEGLPTAPEDDDPPTVEVDPALILPELALEPGHDPSSSDVEDLLELTSTRGRKRVSAAIGTRERNTFEYGPDEQRGPSTGLRLQTDTVLRVRLERLERIGGVASEVLLLSKRMDYHMREFQDVRGELKEWLARAGTDIPKSHVASMRSILHRLDASITSTSEDSRKGSLRTSQLDEEVRSLRHVPLAQSVSHYPRAVRDLAQSQGKRVRFSLDVGNIEVDRPVLTTLADPLLHLVRNAVDHGIESPAERAANGKEPEGEIRLSVEHIGDGLRVTLTDDGRGIDPEYMRERAIAKGIITPERARAMNDQEALGLVFTPGFSTRDIVSDVSGRGIGMDVVLRHITTAGGNVEVSSEAGEGTTFTLRVPLSSVVVSALLVRFGGRVFGIHAKDVERVVDTPGDALRYIHGAPCVRDEDGDLIALLDWRTPLGLPEVKLDGRASMRVLMIRDGARLVGVVVDEVIAERQALNRPLGEFLKGVRMCRGVALTDADEIIPLLNVVEMLARSQRHEPAAVRQTLAGDAGNKTFDRSYSTVQMRALSSLKTILVAEDSEITRALVTGILRGLGYRVLEADDGQMAWEMLQEHRVHLLMTDVQMPRMSGLELLSKVRGDERYTSIPAIVLSTLGSPEDKERAMQLGADGYLVKLDFREKDLIATIQRHLG
jgi:chemotaxis protein histidine kinase CheA